MIKCVFFDLNETLTNTELLGINFKKYFKEEAIAKYWFTKLLHSSVVMGSMDRYNNFGELAKVALEAVAKEYGVILNDEEKLEILSSFKSLPPHADVKESMIALREANIKVIVVSNSSLEMIGMQLKNAGIDDLVDNYYSVDAVSKYKPFKDVYTYVAKEEGIKVDEAYMVACHDWDLFGAKEAGLKTAYIERKNTIYNPYYQQADLMRNDLKELTKEMINF